MKEEKQIETEPPKMNYEIYAKRVKTFTTLILILCILFGVNK